MSFTDVTIFGGNGGFGRLLASKLDALGVRVRGVDLADEPDPAARVAEYVRADATDLTPAAIAAVVAADCVILSLPESIALRAVFDVVGHMRPGALLVDLLSVKTEITELMRRVSRDDVELLSIHPMFAPDRGFSGQNVAAIPVADGPLAARFIALVKDWGSRVTVMTGEEHDATTAALQVATHAAILAFGSALVRLDYDVERALRMATPPHRTLLALLSRILSADPAIYWQIQLGNPMAGEARQALLDGVSDLHRAASDGDDDRFRDWLQAIAGVIGDRRDELASYCRRLFDVGTDER